MFSGFRFSSSRSSISSCLFSSEDESIRMFLSSRFMRYTVLPNCLKSSWKTFGLILFIMMLE